MHGQIDSILHHDPNDPGKLIVTGRLVADTQGELTTEVKKITATLAINGGKPVSCNTNEDANGNAIFASMTPGTAWTMRADTTDCGTASALAEALADHDVTLTHWSQPPTLPQIVVH
jgi:hypothetical protein